MSDTAYPPEAGMVLFTEAYNAHQAATSLIRRGNVPKPDNMSPDAYAQRKAILAVGVKLVLSERDALLDRFCQAWLAYRGQQHGKQT